MSQFCQTEVENLDLAITRQKNILRLEVAMHDAAIVRRCQPACDL